jgi:hypothetical protein
MDLKEEYRKIIKYMLDNDASSDLIENYVETFININSEHAKQFVINGAGKSFEILPSKVFCYYIRKNFFWFRIFGIGITAKNLKTEPLSFSERIGKRKSVQIFDWHLSFLKRNKF